ncbi:hypothetical protein LTS10_008826 [Elasticomyces elasticus]|nr:hypothetical protein LTS10_008826 [Elasticomyces elasticus]
MLAALSAGFTAGELVKLEGLKVDRRGLGVRTQGDRWRNGPGRTVDRGGSLPGRQGDAVGAGGHGDAGRAQGRPRRGTAVAFRAIRNGDIRPGRRSRCMDDGAEPKTIAIEASVADVDVKVKMMMKKKKKKNQNGRELICLIMVILGVGAL